MSDIDQKRKCMNYNNHKNYLIVAVIAATLSACVTINIYFPAAAAEKVAEKIVDEVWQLKDENAKVNVEKLPAKSDAVK